MAGPWFGIVLSRMSVAMALDVRQVPRKMNSEVNLISAKEPRMRRKISFGSSIRVGMVKDSLDEYF